MVNRKLTVDLPQAESELIDPLESMKNDNNQVIYMNLL